MPSPLWCGGACLRLGGCGWGSAFAFGFAVAGWECAPFGLRLGGCGWVVPWALAWLGGRGVGVGLWLCLRLCGVVVPAFVLVVVGGVVPSPLALPWLGGSVRLLAVPSPGRLWVASALGLALGVRLWLCLQPCFSSLYIYFH